MVIAVASLCHLVCCCVSSDLRCRAARSIAEAVVVLSGPHAVTPRMPTKAELNAFFDKRASMAQVMAKSPRPLRATAPPTPGRSPAAQTPSPHAASPLAVGLGNA